MGGNSKAHLALAARLAIAAALISASASAAAEDPTILRETSAVALPVPTFSQMGVAECDAKGDLYFNIFPSDNGLMKISHDGSKYHLYKLPSGDADSKSYGFEEFNVTPSGDLRVLMHGEDQAPYVFLFDPDTGNTSKKKLGLPEHLRVAAFAAFDSGAVLVTGYFERDAGKEKQGKTYTAVFEASGKLSALVTGRFGEVDLASTGKLSEGGAALAEDGFLYLLRPDEVVVISESGTIVRRMPFKKPIPELLADRIDVSGGLIAIELMKDEGVGKAFKTQLLMLNASTGDSVGLYQPEPALGNNLLCFSRGTGFVFLTMRDDKVTLVTAPLR